MSSSASMCQLNNSLAPGYRRYVNRLGLAVSLMIKHFIFPSVDKNSFIFIFEHKIGSSVCPTLYQNQISLQFEVSEKELKIKNVCKHGSQGTRRNGCWFGHFFFISMTTKLLVKIGRRHMLESIFVILYFLCLKWFISPFPSISGLDWRRLMITLFLINWIDEHIGSDCLYYSLWDKTTKRNRKCQTD